MASPEQSTTLTRRAAKSDRILACVLCQQRKVKCDRRFPCANCVRASTQCVPATLAPRKRRRKIPETERVLLDRIHYYEDLLRRHNIDFELTPFTHTSKDATTDPVSAQSPRHSSPAVTASGQDGCDQEAPKTQGFQHALDRWFQEANEDDTGSDIEEDHSQGTSTIGDSKHDIVFTKVWRSKARTSTHLLFGFRQMNLVLSTLHPNQVQIFRLWQVYLDNVNPLLKVTHTPTLQPQIIDAASNVSSIEPPLEALMFSIYCISVMSLTDNQCRAQFGSSRADLLQGYQLGCQQALLQCNFLSTGSRDCLTAIFLYLMSVRSDADPRSVASVLGLALRIAERIGIHNEATNSNYPVLEAEMRRRLWWSLVHFDNRMCEISGFKDLTRASTLGCKPPLNVNDFDMRPEMQTAPEAHKTPTEALFVVTRSELSELLRRAFLPPNEVWSISDHTRTLQRVDDIEKELEDRHFSLCNPENPLHFMALWTNKNLVAKARLMSYYSSPADSILRSEPSNRRTAFSDALSILESDTKLAGSPITRGFDWYSTMYFPLPAYMHLVHDLKERPLGEHADQAWRIMSDNFQARFRSIEHHVEALVRVFGKKILQIWYMREAALASGPTPPTQTRPSDLVPGIVSGFQRLLTQRSTNSKPQIGPGISKYNSHRPPVGTSADLNITATETDFTNPMLAMTAADSTTLNMISTIGLDNNSDDFLSQPSADMSVNMLTSPMMDWSSTLWNYDMNVQSQYWW